MDFRNLFKNKMSLQPFINTDAVHWIIRLYFLLNTFREIVTKTKLPIWATACYITTWPLFVPSSRQCTSTRGRNRPERYSGALHYLSTKHQTRDVFKEFVFVKCVKDITMGFLLLWRRWMVYIMRFCTNGMYPEVFKLKMCRGFYKKGHDGFLKLDSSCWHIWRSFLKLPRTETTQGGHCFSNFETVETVFVNVAACWSACFPKKEFSF